MNFVWTATTIFALTALTIQSPQKVLTVCVDSGAQALTTAIGLCGVYCLWMGIFAVAEKCNLVEKLSKLLAPLNKKLYGRINEAAAQYISINLASNLLGVGNAATPSAIAALKETEMSEKLSPAGAMLFVVNACGVQLVPTTVIGLRASVGSANAADVLLPNLAATFASVALGIVLTKLCYKGKG